MSELLRPDELAYVERFFGRYGAATVFFGRLLPVVRTYVAFPAGLAHMPMLKFQAYTFAGSWPWCLALAYLGMFLFPARLIKRRRTARVSSAGPSP